MRPLFYTRLRLGEFDPPEMNPYRALGMDTVQSPAHQALALEAAIKTLVLLKNAEDTLPLRAQDLAGGRIAVSTPHTDTHGRPRSQGTRGCLIPGHPQSLPQGMHCSLWPWADTTRAE